MLRDEINVLVVDDVNAMRVQVRELLKQFGFKRITLAADGSEAKEKLANEVFQLVLCDWHMAPMDGSQLLTWVRTQPHLKDTAFIMVTAESTKEKVISIIKLGVDDYLVKPLTVAQIQNKVFGVLLRKNVIS